ncbi:MAG: hypothetical protein R3C32_11340 [Chloroflexota bacterium]
MQALIREVAYGTLARRDRKARHLAAARWFESLGIDELSGALAVQYLAAHANAGSDDEAAALAVQARIALRAAADRARSLGAFEQAASFLRQALAVTIDDREAAELLEEAGVALSHASRPSEAVAVLRDALGRQEALGDRVAAARVTAALGEALQSGGQWEDALDILEPASHAYEDLGASERAYMLLLGQLARSHMLADRHEPAIETADRVLRVAEQMDAVDIVADVLITRGSALCLLAQPYSGLGAIQAGHDLALAHQFQGTLLRALNNLTAYAGLSDPRAALDNALAGLALARRTGERSMVAYLGGNAVEVAADVGAWDIARRETELLLADQAFGEEDRSVMLAALVPFLAIAGHDLDEVEALHAQVVSLPAGYGDVEPAIDIARGKLEEARLGYLSSGHPEPPPTRPTPSSTPAASPSSCASPTGSGLRWRGSWAWGSAAGPSRATSASSVRGSRPSRAGRSRPGPGSTRRSVTTGSSSCRSRWPWAPCRWASPWAWPTRGSWPRWRRGAPSWPESAPRPSCGSSTGRSPIAPTPTPHPTPASTTRTRPRSPSSAQPPRSPDGRPGPVAGAGRPASPRDRPSPCTIPVPEVSRSTRCSIDDGGPPSPVWRPRPPSWSGSQAQGAGPEPDRASGPTTPPGATATRPPGPWVEPVPAPQGCVPEVEANDQPADAGVRVLPTEFCVSGTLEAVRDQDLYFWEVPGEDGLTTWDVSVRGVPTTYTSVHVFQLDSPVGVTPIDLGEGEVARVDSDVWVGTPVPTTGLRLRPGPYLLGISRAEPGYDQDITDDLSYWVELPAQGSCDPAERGCGAQR